jgi:DNA-binding XRE family transcriptional regulator
MKLAMTGQSGNDAAALRVLAARKYSGLSQDALAAKIDRKETTITAIEKGRQLPSWQLMMWFHQNKRIDPTFFVAGEFNHLSGDVQDGLFGLLLDEAERRGQPLV